ncbi:photosynthetic complex putative assembly protein PuhB [Pseudorhodoferax sp. Leaf267]|uniref:photosynthetic complex putative assembly protein PuhB n=1 Tax=Pseudorhodoferax sp. Leaf267 TaxID=1736316 RepID=UPI0009E84FED|nr:photosynthetic complex putative assembly protein PuhB [Pseudorhodoferax sp. Leaf267]
MKAVNILEPAHEHEFEATHGLPEALPPGETLLWQGSPDAKLIAVQALHIRKVALYFALLLAWRLASDLYDGAGLGAALWGCLGMLAPITLGLGLIAGMAWLIARTSVYTLTSQRVVMRIGVVLSITFNLPLKRIAAASQRKGSGDIALALAGDDRIAYPHLWPHARPWHLRQPQPLLRALPAAQAAAVAAQLAQALRVAHAQAALPAEEAAQPLPQRPVRELPAAAPTVSPQPTRGLHAHA